MVIAIAMMVVMVLAVLIVMVVPMPVVVGFTITLVPDDVVPLLTQRPKGGEGEQWRSPE